MRMRTIAALAAGTWLVCTPAAGQTSTEPDLFRAGPDTYAPRFDPRQTRPPTPYPVPPLLGVASDDIPPRQARRSGAPDVQAPADSRGHLTLVVRPAMAQIYVDGFFVGTIEDYISSPGPLIEAGPHRVELRADGYEPAQFDVRIVAGDVVTHRGDLLKVGPTPATPAAMAPPVSVPSRTLYVIPRCYAGDTPPRASHLPAGCSIADVRIVPGDQGSGRVTPQPSTPAR